MSDFILKFFPEKEIESDKTQLIKESFIQSNIISGEEIEFQNDVFFKPGILFCAYFNFEDDADTNNIQKEARIKILSDGYGLRMDHDAEEPEFFDCKNVIEIWNIDGRIKSWHRLMLHLSQTTGNTYLGEWEFL